MKLAAITDPNGFGTLTEMGQSFHFVLAQYVLSDPEYAAYYRLHHSKGDFVILDNGAAEGGPLPVQNLVQAAELVHADEVIVPDVLRNREKTEALVREAINEIPNYYRLMIVPQAEMPISWMQSCGHFVMKYDFRTIGIPKHTETFKGGRLNLLKFIEEEGINLTHDIHLLGIWKDPLSEILPIVERFPWVRSLDTAMPFAYAQHNESIQTSGINEHISHEWGQPIGLQCAVGNIAILRTICRT